MVVEKLYCHIDETGQDTEGELFIVAAVVCDNPKALREKCLEFEKRSRKGKFKWGKAKPEYRFEYMNLVLQEDLFKQALRFCVFHNTKDYDKCTVDTIIRASRWNEPSVNKYNLTIYVDGLSKTKARAYRSGISRNGVYVRKVRGVKKDENSPLVRLADALAGFVRDAANNSEINKLYRLGVSNGSIIEV